MTDSEDGSMLVGQSASKKLGGPEMYRVARIALTAGEPGKRTAKRRSVAEEVWCACAATFSAERAWTIGQSYCFEEITG